MTEARFFVRLMALVHSAYSDHTFGRPGWREKVVEAGDLIHDFLGGRDPSPATKGVER